MELGADDYITKPFTRLELLQAIQTRLQKKAEREQVHQDSLFTTFQRGSNVGSISGTGLDLAIVKQAVDLQNGSILLESQVGEGTTVTVTLPV
jgi:light-regulated signal transduction histidine kinase (bacteriophytochrome)